MEATDTLSIEREQMQILWDSLSEEERKRRIQNATTSKALAKKVKEVYDRLNALLQADGCDIIVREDGSHKIIKPRTTRFGPADYAKLIDYGEDPGSDDAKRARKHLGDRYGGGFVFIHENPQCKRKNGIYELRIYPGHAKNAVCSLVRVELHQHYKQGGRWVAGPVIAFPPKSGDKRECRRTAKRIEVQSMTRVTSEARLNSPQSPAVVFDLRNVERVPQKRSAKAAPKQKRGLETATIKQLMVYFRRICARWSYASIAANIIVDRVNDVPGGRNRYVTGPCVRTWHKGTSFPCEALHEEIRGFLIRYRDNRDSLNLAPAGERSS